MKISIVTPAYNAALLISKCIDSVKNQTYKDVEHIIINDGSKDDTRRVIADHEGTYSIKCLDQDNRGIAYSMTRGFKEATGDIFGWIDSDNYYYENILEKVVNIFENNPELDVVYGNVDIVDGNGKILNTYKPPKHLSLKNALVRATGAIPVQPAVFFKRTLYEKIAGFDTRYRIAGDYDFWLKALALKPKTHYEDISFGNYLRDDKAISQSLKGIIRGYKEVMDIVRNYNQTLYGKCMIFIKYAKGFAKAILR